MEERSVMYRGIFAADFRHGMSRMHENWGWLMALGIALSILGFFCIITAGVATWVSVVFFGAILAVSGGIQIVHAFSFRIGHGFFLNLLLGVLYTVVGVLMMARPDIGAVSLTVLLSAFFLVAGIFRCVWSAVTRYPNWGWGFFSGLVTTFLGLLIGASLPSSALWVIGTFIGIELIFSGFSWMALASAAHRYEGTEAIGEPGYPRKAG